jgi:hypothetical protein
MYIYSGIHLVSITAGFAGFYAYTAHKCRKRIIIHYFIKSLLVTPGLRMVEPALNVFAGRAGTIARRHKIGINRPLCTPVAGTRRMLQQINRLSHVGTSRHGNVFGKKYQPLLPKRKRRNFKASKLIKG